MVTSIFSKKVHVFVAVLFAVALFASFHTHAATELQGGAGSESSGGAGNQSPGGAGTETPGGSTSNCGKNGGEGTLINPLKACDIPEFLLALIEVLVVFATPIIVLFIMYAGFKFVTAAGNPSEIESARTALLWAVVGGVIVLGARLIIEVIQGTIETF